MPTIGGTKWGPSKALGTTGGVVTWSITPAGTDITRFQSFGAQGSTSVDPSTFISIDYLSALRRAFDQWAAAGNIEFIQVQDPGGAAATSGVGLPDIRISFGLIDGPGGNFDGFGFFPPPNGGFDGDILLDTVPAYNRFPQYLYTLAMHEIGHAIGFGHVDVAAIMNPDRNFANNIVFTELQPDDITGVQTLYGVQDNGLNVYNFPIGLINLTILDGAPNLTINGNNLNNVITATNSSEAINGGGGDDTISGGGGNDNLTGGIGADVLKGDSGFDYARYDAAPSGITANLLTPAANTGDAAGDQYFSIEGLVGSSAGDVLNGDHSQNDLIGLAGIDVIDARGGNDSLRGGPGDDNLDGGPGIDRAFFGGLRSAYAITALPGNALRIIGPDGNDLVSNVERLIFEDQSVNWPLGSLLPLDNDFNGDGNGDVLWRYSDGFVAEWQMNGDQIALNMGVATPGNEWKFQDTGDFGGDGKSDVMWRHPTGQVVLWQMNGIQIVSNTSILEVSNQYHVQGAADFSGDGKSDVLFRHDSGQVVLWQMDGDKIAVNTAVANVSQQYHVQGIGDLNGDGQSDVVWRHDSGQFVLWQMDGDKIVSNTAIVEVSNQYKVQDVSDYNGDGMSDVLLRHDSGQVVLWQMNGDTIASNTEVTTIANDWTIQAHHFDLV